MPDNSPTPPMRHASSVDSNTDQAGSEILSAYDQARQRLIVALDVASPQAAITLADSLGEQCQWFKVGLELFIAGGPAIVETLVSRGHSVFLDLKLHDIPNQVAGAVRSAARLGARMLTVHAGGGPAMLTAAREALAGISSAPELLAVTVLTSMDQQQLEAIGHSRSPQAQVEHLAKMGISSGYRGFVCSSEEAATLRKLVGPPGVLVVPGIRPSGAERGDQRRVATPTEALSRGASYLVVGRPITGAADPAMAAEAILLEIAEAMGNAPTY